MYCRKCGCELPSDGQFCPKCGCEVNRDVKEVNSHKADNDTTKSQKKKTLKILITCLCCLLVISGAVLGVSIYRNEKFIELSDKGYVYLADDEIEKAVDCWQRALEIKSNISNISFSGISRELNLDIVESNLSLDLEYYRAILNSDDAIENKHWDEAVDYLSTAITLRPYIEENYLSLATAYVEQWDLCNAEKTLKKGYEVTKDNSLKNVSIWGPLSPIEIAYCMVDTKPLTRCEYLFSDNGINSYYHIMGMPMAGAKYYCDDEKVTFITLLDYDDYFDASSFPQHFLGLPVFDSVLTYFELEYNEDNKVSAVTYDGYAFVTLEYTGDNCTSITAQMDFRNMFSVGDIMSFCYNSDNMISQISLGDGVVEFKYNDNGVIASIPATNTVYGFDESGLMNSITKDGIEVFAAKTDNGHITSITTFDDANDSLEFNFEYENERLAFLEVVNGAGSATMYDSIAYFYDEVNGENRLSKMVFTLTDHITTNEITMTYDNEGKLIRIFNEFNGYDMELNYIEDKLSSYVMTAPDYTKTTRIINYDNEGHFIDRD